MQFNMRSCINKGELMEKEGYDSIILTLSSQVSTYWQ